MEALFNSTLLRGLMELSQRQVTVRKSVPGPCESARGFAARHDSTRYVCLMETERGICVSLKERQGNRTRDTEGNAMWRQEPTSNQANAGTLDTMKGKTHDVRCPSLQGPGSDSKSVLTQFVDSPWSAGCKCRGSWAQTMESLPLTRRPDGDGGHVVTCCG
jgi:hypothetical protein